MGKRSKQPQDTCNNSHDIIHNGKTRDLQRSATGVGASVSTCVLVVHACHRTGWVPVGQHGYECAG
eukprot:8350376-Lingulodinium_polyedra.AAC.1